MGKRTKIRKAHYSPEPDRRRQQHGIEKMPLRQQLSQSWAKIQSTSENDLVNAIEKMREETVIGTTSATNDIQSTSEDDDMANAIVRMREGIMVGPTSAANEKESADEQQEEQQQKSKKIGKKRNKKKPGRKPKSAIQKLQLQKKKPGMEKKQQKGAWLGSKNWDWVAEPAEAVPEKELPVMRTTRMQKLEKMAEKKKPRKSWKQKQVPPIKENADDAQKPLKVTKEKPNLKRTWSNVNPLLYLLTSDDVHLEAESETAKKKPGRKEKKIEPGNKGRRGRKKKMVKKPEVETVNSVEEEKEEEVIQGEEEQNEVKPKKTRKKRQKKNWWAWIVEEAPNEEIVVKKARKKAPLRIKREMKEQEEEQVIERQVDHEKEDETHNDESVLHGEEEILKKTNEGEEIMQETREGEESIHGGMEDNEEGMEEATEKEEMNTEEEEFEQITEGNEMVDQIGEVTAKEEGEVRNEEEDEEDELPQLQVEEVSHEGEQNQSAVSPSPLPVQAMPPPPQIIPRYIRVDSEGYLHCRAGDIVADRYEVIKEVGEGVYAKVFRVRDWGDSKKIKALKIVRNSPAYREAARQEIELLQQMDKADPDKREQLVVRMLDYFDFRGHACILFNILGASVFDFMKKNEYHPFPLYQIRYMGYQLIHALRFLHNLHLTHTDLKPENILFVNSEKYDKEPRWYKPDPVWETPPEPRNGRNKPDNRFKVLKDASIRIIDMGSAVSDDQQHDIIVSTRHYRAPEVILELDWNQSCDVWSLGCILFELYTGHPLIPQVDDEPHLAMLHRILPYIPSWMKHETRTGYYQGRNLVCSRQSHEFAKRQAKPLKEYIRKDNGHHRALFDLIGQMLNFDPRERITLAAASDHHFFDELEPALKQKVDNGGGDEVVDRTGPSA